MESRTAVEQGSLFAATAELQSLPALPRCIAALAPALLSWFAHSGRKHLPWQREPSAYRVWVSEIMLQQTQVVTVIGYYQRFMARFPELAALAQAPIDEVLHLWTGLGYYARARNLHRAAQHIMSEHGGRFPESFAQVEALPGIGRSTAGAILALAFDQCHAILDGNVKRVLSRYFAIHGHASEPRVEQQLWALAQQCTPRTSVAHYTQAIMDLGATVCVRARPHCLACPLREHCAAHAAGLQQQLPTPRARKSRPQRSAYVLLLRRADGAVLLEQRPPSGIWGGLGALPQFESQQEAQRWLGSTHARSTAQTLAPYHHAFTHFDLTLHPLVVEAGPATRVAEARMLWYDPRQPAKIGLAKPTVDLIARLLPPLVPSTS